MDIQKLTNEFTINCSLEHPNIVKMYLHFAETDPNDPSFTSYCILMEMADDNLSSMIKQWHKDK